METLLLIFGIIAYLIISFLIGFWKSKGINLADFIASRDSVGFWAILLSLVGTIVGGGMFFAVGQIGYEAGIVGYIIGFLYIIAFFLMGLVIPRIRNLFKDKNYLTLIDLVDGEYKSKKTTFAFAIVNFFIYFFVLAAQFLVLGTFLSFFAGIQLTYAILLIAMVVAGLNIIIYSVVGGIRKDIATDVFQVILVFIGSLLLISLLFRPAAWASISTLPAIYFTGLGYGTVFLIGIILFLIPLLFVRLDFWQRILAAKNEKVARKAFFTAGPLTFLFYFIFTTIGMYAKSFGIPEAKIATLGLLDQVFTGIPFVVVILAFLAAVMSTADTALNVATVSFSRLFKRKTWHRYLASQEDDKQLLKLVKIFALLIGLVSVIVAFLVPDIVDLFVASFAAVLILAPATFALLFSKRPNSKAAFYSIILGFLVFLGLFAFIPKESFVAGVFISILTYLIVNKFGKKSAENLAFTE
jgi:SSS family solute:Na+ symporter